MKKCAHGRVEGVGCRECAHTRHRITQIYKAIENLIRSLSDERHKTALTQKALRIDTDINTLAEMRERYR